MISYKKTILDNGISVVSEKIPASHSICIGVWIKVGSRYEDAGNNGISHFVEHMGFKGTKTRNSFEIAKSLESVGGNLNAFTGKELTCYFAHILNKDLALAIDILSDITGNALFENDDIANEKDIIIEENNSIEDAPEELVYEYFHKHLFLRHPLGFPVLGETKNIKSFTRKALIDFWKRNYDPHRVVISASGDVDHIELTKLIDKFFSFPSGVKTRRVRGKRETKGGRTVIEKDIAQTHICMGTIGCSYRKREKYPLMLLTTLLGGGMSSRLFQIIREKHALAYSVYTFTEFLSDSGIFGIYAGTEKEKVSRVMELIFRELKKMRDKRVSERELDRIKSQLTGNLMLGLESVSSRMTRLAKMELYLGHYYSLENVIKEISSITADDVLETANKILDEDKIYTTILGSI